MATGIEYKLNQVDEYEDIIETDMFRYLKDAKHHARLLAQALPSGHRIEIEKIKVYWNDVEGVSGYVYGDMYNLTISGWIKTSKPWQ